MRSASFLERMEFEFLKRLQENPSLKVEYAKMIGKHYDDFYQFEKLASKIVKLYNAKTMREMVEDRDKIADATQKENFTNFQEKFSGKFRFKNSQGQKRPKKEGEDKGKFRVDLKHIKVETEFFTNKIKVEQIDDD